MIESIYQLDFITTSGTPVTTNLLAIGDWIDKEIEFPMQNQVETFAAIGALWGKARSKGGARRPIDWARYKEHVSHAAAATYCLTHPASLPFTTPGKVRVTISSATPVIYDLMDAVIVTAISFKTTEGEFATVTSYRVEAGKTVYVSG